MYNPSGLSRLLVFLLSFFWVLCPFPALRAFPHIKRLPCWEKSQHDSPFSVSQLSQRTCAPFISAGDGEIEMDPSPKNLTAAKTENAAQGTSEANEK